MNDRPIGALIKELMANLTALLRSELHLTALELKSNAREAALRSRRAVVFLLIATLGAFSLLACAIIALGRLLGDSYGWSALIVGAALGAIGAAGGILSLKDLGENRQMPRTRTNLQDDAQVISGKVEQITDHIRKRVS